MTDVEVTPWADGPTSHDAPPFPMDLCLDENPGATEGPSSFESCGPFPYDEVVASFTPEPPPPEARAVKGEAS